MRPTGANTRMSAWRLSPMSTAAPVALMRRHCQEFGGQKQDRGKFCGKPPFLRINVREPARLGLLVATAGAPAVIAKREYGTALGPAPDRLAVTAAPQFLGSHRAADGA